MTSDARAFLPRAGIAVLSLVGLLLATYLTMYKLGYFGTIQCGVGACEVVQSSRYAYLLGQPVALWGMLGYAVIFVIAFVGAHPPFLDSRRVSDLLLLLTGGAFGFSMYLTYLEAFVIHAWCRYCVVSAVLATLCFLLSVIDWRARRDQGRSVAATGSPGVYVR